MNQWVNRIRPGVRGAAVKKSDRLCAAQRRAANQGANHINRLPKPGNLADVKNSDTPPSWLVMPRPGLPTSHRTGRTSSARRGGPWPDVKLLPRGARGGLRRVEPSRSRNKPVASLALPGARAAGGQGKKAACLIFDIIAKLTGSRRSEKLKVAPALACRCAALRSEFRAFFCDPFAFISTAPH